MIIICTFKFTLAKNGVNRSHESKLITVGSTVGELDGMGVANVAVVVAMATGATDESCDANEFNENN